MQIITFEVDFTVAVRVEYLDDALYKRILLKFRQRHELIDAQWARTVQV